MTFDDGTYTAVIDRFEANQAVLLVEDEDGAPCGEVVVDRAVLPEAGQHVDAVLLIELEAGELRNASYEKTETERRTHQVRDRFDRLSQRLSSADESDTSE
ncbi:DUF3006 domain-containing protein [Halocatena salina]|uniref:DUF3006 domain-containing protein n=1 Tax=Halocatena salina TaxID=2934340 RepID=A0A8U0A8X9_9EURY|nr:DUF3006 domain-containing protein [Halocatena salina]UPM45286.1 DUF3006 domain-containing protein [Halocatena salina]